MDWFAHHHGTATDAKWAPVARLAGCQRYHVYAVWCALMERASAARDRGSIAGFDAVDLGESWGLDAEVIDRIVQALRDRKLIVGDRLTKWNERQPKRDATNAARQARFKAKKRDSKTGGNALPRYLVTGNGPRGEESVAILSDMASRQSDTSIHLPPSHAHEREANPKSRGRVFDWVKSLVSQEGGSDANCR